MVLAPLAIASAICLVLPIPLAYIIEIFGINITPGKQSIN
jgi:hypothetical protein